MLCWFQDTSKLHPGKASAVSLETTKKNLRAKKRAQREGKTK